MLYFERWKTIAILAVVLLGVLYAAPNLYQSFDEEQPARSGIAAWLPYKTINLGLDLQGGSHLLLEVETDAVVTERVEGLLDGVRTALRESRVQRREFRTLDDGVAFELLDPAQGDMVAQTLREEYSDLVVSVDDATVTARFPEAVLQEMRSRAVEQSIEIVRRRIDELGTREPLIQRQGDNRIVVQLPGVDDPNRVISLLGQTAKLTFHIVEGQVGAEEARSTRPPPAQMLVQSAEQPDIYYLVNKRIIVGGESLVDAQPAFDNGQPIVSFRFDSAGGTRFGRATTENVNRPLGIVLDGKVISAPVVREPILGGRGQISGSFSTQQAQDLALLLRAGALPAPLTALETRTVGPGLGQDSIDAGKVAVVVGFLAVVVFMVLTYGFFGLLANVALIANLVILVALLSVLQATLTLPGIAGIVLTMGMAVDANVLIFERIREELRIGRPAVSAIEAGYSRAMTTIIDSNLTGLIAAILLFALGSGPIKGFAVTLSLGIVTSMFTAIWVTRLLVVWWLRRTRPKTLPI